MKKRMFLFVPLTVVLGLINVAVFVMALLSQNGWLFAGFLALLLLTLLLGYLLATALGAAVGVQYAAAVAGFAAGIVAAIAYDRKLRARGGVSFTIVRLF